MANRRNCWTCARTREPGKPCATPEEGRHAPADKAMAAAWAAPRTRADGRVRANAHSCPSHRGEEDEP